MVVYDKLVRDRIPEIIRRNGDTPVFRILNETDYWTYLLKKDSEELEEVRLAETSEERKKELADKLEVLRAMAEYQGFSLEDILMEADRKKENCKEKKKPQSGVWYVSIDKKREECPVGRIFYCSRNGKNAGIYECGDRCGDQGRRFGGGFGEYPLPGDALQHLSSASSSG